MEISVNFPGELLVAAKIDQDQFQYIVMLYTLGHLYEQGKISSGYGAEILGCSRYEFYRLLSEHEFNVIDYAPHEMDDETKSSYLIAENFKQKALKQNPKTAGI